MQELPKSYAPQEVEDKWYQVWESNGLFHADSGSPKKPYTVVIPPPNITGILTMGHVLNNTLQDVFVRWRRMQGYEACWVPGTDHAGIATQHVVEKSLQKEGIARRELGREKFVERVWQWRELYGGTIIKQLRKLGTSCDWKRERFTMDEGLSNAVQEVFVRLHEKGLIYRGKYIVNWCPKDHTALSDDEVNYSDSNGHLWYIRYPVEGSAQELVVATTRPETMLGDTAVAVNPGDERYKELVGRRVRLPLANRSIPIIADDFVDAEFGTGAVKVTPAHDPNDFQIGERHKLEKPIIMDTSGKMNEQVPNKYRGLDRYECRKEVLRDLEREQLLVKTVDHVHSVGHCYRCDTVIEPYLSDQWFVKMKPLSEKALAVVQSGEVKFYPERWTKVYEHWMTNIRDWCISRQLWWGHRVPAWYCDSSEHPAPPCREPVVSRTRPVRCAHCGGTKFRQDEDVLDTWFSSWLWPFSVFDWPKESKDLEYFYPTDTLVTAPDIIFFWVARMIMAGLEFRGKVPFHDVYFTSIIRDMQGRKMSKSLGNSPDPLDVIATYGADALRFTVLYLAPIGQDVLYSNEKCEMGRNFANKIWNAGRFLLLNRDALEAESPSAFPVVGSAPSNDLSDKWIVSRFNATVKATTESLEHLQVNEAAKLLYEFMWHDFCDWYVEFAKNRIAETPDPNMKKAIVQRAIRIYEETLKLLHPFMPFVTEEIWQHLAERRPGESIMKAPWPECEAGQLNPVAEKEMELVQEIVSGVRTIRSEMNLPPAKEVDAIVNCHEEGKKSILENNRNLIVRLARVANLTIGTGLAKPGYSASSVIQGQELFVPLKGLIDIDVERTRLEKEISRIEGQLRGVEAKLSNPSFADKAPAEIVEKERDKKQNFEQTILKLRASLSQVQG
ncbi:MAG TPA: valine--tRNA ligase [Bacteroidota bacterium]|nr:valine--tRNA ligase [Bacteroidota bacterium]